MIHAGFERFSVKNSNFHRDEPFLISSGFGSLIRGSRQYFCSSLSQESSELCQPSRNELPPLPTRYTIRPFLDPSLWRMWESDFRSTTKRVGIIGEESGVFTQIVTRWRPIFIFNSMDSIYDLLRLLSQDLPLWNIVIAPFLTRVAIKIKTCVRVMRRCVILKSDWKLGITLYSWLGLTQVSPILFAICLPSLLCNLISPTNLIHNYRQLQNSKSRPIPRINFFNREDEPVFDSPSRETPDFRKEHIRISVSGVPWKPTR